MNHIFWLVFATGAYGVKTGAPVYKVAPTDDLLSLVDMKEVVFTEFIDKKREQHWEDFDSAFTDAAKWFRSQFAVYGPSAWLSVDIREYPDLTFEGRYSDLKPKKGHSYIYVLVNEEPGLIEFSWDKSKDYEENADRMKYAVLDQVLWPVDDLNECSDILKLINRQYEDDQFRFLVRFDERKTERWEGYFKAA